MSYKKCIIIHGCPSNAEKAMNPEKRTYDKHWIPWVKNYLIAQNINTVAPLMPSPWKPNYKKFKAEFEKYSVDKNTILIGHSCGCAFLVRWLGETKTKIFKLFLIAPWKIPQKERRGKDLDFYTYPIDLKIKTKVNQIVIFTADNEENNGKRSLKIFHEALGGEVIRLKGRGHYCFANMKTEEFPELIEKVLQ